MPDEHILEQRRQQAEAVRAKDEDSRQNAEETRQVTEEQRVVAESGRSEAEQFRRRTSTGSRVYSLGRSRRNVPAERSNARTLAAVSAGRYERTLAPGSSRANSREKRVLIAPGGTPVRALNERITRSSPKDSSRTMGELITVSPRSLAQILNVRA
jgi:hypothetical protein